jgi:hypothetical protein
MSSMSGSGAFARLAARRFQPSGFLLLMRLRGLALRRAGFGVLAIT